MGGISPDKKEGYKIPSIDRDICGYDMLAYYYVSWALAMPDKVNQLGLPFDTAYQNALDLFTLASPTSKFLSPLRGFVARSARRGRGRWLTASCAHDVRLQMVTIVSASCE